MSACERTCKVCASLCRDGVIEHGRGCFAIRPEGGGSEFCPSCLSITQPETAKFLRPMGERDRVLVELVIATRRLREVAAGRDGAAVAAAREQIINAAQKLAGELEKMAPPELETWIAEVKAGR